ncbi:MAG: hypothetical protein ACLRP8_05005 [Roseburia intestinalis]
MHNTYLFNFNRDISTENKNDMGEIKALVLARGDKVANYKDILGVDGKTYDDTTGMYCYAPCEGQQMDQLFHGIANGDQRYLMPEYGKRQITSLGLTGNRFRYHDRCRRQYLYRDSKYEDLRCR